ncbi:MAG TPA: efflux transporter outer membrane subunit [Verrucomicrobiae bacterium]|nr:efflux transporter outer membrane subunit [Verrucomicrobiae bacterium]
MKTTFATVLLTGSLLAGCAVGPDYHPPKTQAPASWSEARLGGTTNSAIQIVEWWKTFNDPELNSLIQRAVVTNYDLRIADGRLREARALRSFAAWDLGPAINAGGGYTDVRQSRNSLPFITTGPVGSQISSNYIFQYDLYDAHFDASWEIDVFGGKRRALQEANALLASAQEDRHDVLVSVLAEVARNYMEVRNFQQRIAITRNNIAAQQDAVEIARSRFNAGLGSELEVKQSEAVLATTQSQLPVLETTLKHCIHRLGVLLGQPPGALTAELSTETPVPAPPPEVPVGLPSDLLRRRPDVRRAERELAAATANIGVQTAELFPKFSLTGIAGFQSFSVGDWFSGGSKYWQAGPAVTWRLFDLGRVRSQIQTANAQAQQSLDAYERTVLMSFEDVENGLVAYANEQTRYRALATAVDAERHALDLANARYKQGLADFLNVVDAERSLYQAEDDLANSQSTVSIDLVTLYKSLGGGWEPSSGVVTGGPSHAKL